VQGPQNWNSDTQSNINWILDVMAASESLVLGVKTTASDWQAIVGDWKGASPYYYPNAGYSPGYCGGGCAGNGNASRLW